jgi:hypothetical protein
VRRRRSRPIRIKADESLKYGRPKPVMITRARFAELEEGLQDHYYRLIVQDWEEERPPASPKDFARTVVWRVSQNRSGGVTDYAMAQRCIGALERGKSASAVYRHSRKAKAMDHVWQQRATLFREWRRLRDDHDRVRFCGRLPFFGRLSRYELARDLGANVVIPDWRMTMLAHREGLSVWDTCHRLAQHTGYREATIGMLLETAFDECLLDPHDLWCYGWDEGTPRLDLARRRLRIKAKYASADRAACATERWAHAAS